MFMGILVFLSLDTTLIGLYLHGSDAGIDSALTVQYARQYLKIMLFNIPPFVITQVYAGSLRETGESVKPMIAGVCSVVVDIVFNYLLIYGRFGFPRLGVYGTSCRDGDCHYLVTYPVKQAYFLKRNLSHSESADECCTCGHQKEPADILQRIFVGRRYCRADAVLFPART